MSEYKLALVGFGSVGRALARLLVRQAAIIEQYYRITWRVVGIATRTRGMAVNPDGIDVLAAAEEVENGGTLDAFHMGNAVNNTETFISVCAADLLFENSTLNSHTGQPALAYTRAALNSAMHVVTANKGPVVYGYRELRDIALANGKRFLFEATVMDGTPIFSTFRIGLPASRVIRFRGILNSTSNVIITGMEQGKTFEEGVEYAKDIGVAEADVANDVDGWDAAVKTAVLTSVLMDYPLRPQEVEREGIRDLTSAQVQDARAEGAPIKLLCSVQQADGNCHAVVKPTQIALSDPLSRLDGTSSGVALYLDTLREVVVAGIDHGPEQTAFGLLADFINVVRGY